MKCHYHHRLCRFKLWCWLILSFGVSVQIGSRRPHSSQSRAKLKSQLLITQSISFRLSGYPNGLHLWRTTAQVRHFLRNVLGGFSDGVCSQDWHITCAQQLKLALFVCILISYILRVTEMTDELPLICIRHNLIIIWVVCCNSAWCWGTMQGCMINRAKTNLCLFLWIL